MDEDKKESPDKKGKGNRPPFTAVDWIVAALSIALLVYILANIPAF